MLTTEKQQFIVNKKGKKVGVLLDMPTYEKFLEAYEDMEDIRDYDEVKEKVEKEIANGDVVTLEEYLRKRKIKIK